MLYSTCGALGEKKMALGFEFGGVDGAEHFLRMTVTTLVAGSVG
jgi:hypothetical protein